MAPSKYMNATVSASELPKENLRVWTVKIISVVNFVSAYMCLQKGMSNSTKLHTPFIK